MNAPPPPPIRSVNEGDPRMLLTVVGIAGTLALGFLIVFLFTPHEMNARVVGMKWIHIARYEERTVHTSEGWGSPDGAFNVTCQNRYYGQRPCSPYSCNYHTESYSCGSTKYPQRCSRTVHSTCWRSCPVYRDWCRYNHYVWEKRNEQTLAGESPHNLMWPDMGPADETHRTIKVPAYIVHFKHNEDRFSFDPETSERFMQFDTGQNWVCEKAIIGSFKPLRRAR